MAILWTLEPGGTWRRDDLDGDDLALAGGARLLRRPDGRGERWLLLSPAAAGAVVNGRPAPPARLLRDRDELRLARSPRLVFGQEPEARVEPFPGRVDAVCPRCRSPIAAGDAAVQCPGCHVWHHLTDELPCWTHAATCGTCDHPTPLGAGPRWTPESL